jgi:hypothetical protein
MSQVIVYTKNNNIAVVHPTPEAIQTLSMSQIAEKDVPEGIAYRITDISNIPSTREFRNAWTDANPGDTVDVDMNKAKTIQADKIRTARDAKWDDFDKRYVMAQRNGDDLTALDVERQMLRDIPNNAQVDIDAAANPDVLKAVWPAELL